ncbi:uncharacterized protein EKO05_0007448 [Ascochyta rabiei]|nr:uncharacterized protein EKO05_0007448 [Ascochyta rabiei]UPX17072.1 hypothetical protein EKO05_0007448 [Ascochyta rabiei]
MPQQRRKRSALGSRPKLLKPDYFAPFLADIQGKLGESWVFYEECMDGILDAAASQQDTIAWLEQMQQLVDGYDTVTFSHEGVLFLLGGMGIQLPKQRNWGEGEKHHVGIRSSPPLLPVELSAAPHSPRVDNMATLPLRPHNTMASLLPHRSLQPTLPSHTPHTQQEQQRQAPSFLDRTQRVLPFDFSASTQPVLTLPKDLKAFYYPPEQIILTENHVPPPPNPLRKHSSNPVFFTDPPLREDVAELFGHAVRGENSNSRNVSQMRSSTIAFYTIKRQTLPYHPSDDDMLVWMKRLGSGEDDQAGGGEVKQADWVGSTWPTWNLRFDLEL